MFDAFAGFLDDQEIFERLQFCGILRKVSIVLNGDVSTKPAEPVPVSPWKSHEAAMGMPLGSVEVALCGPPDEERNRRAGAILANLVKAIGPGKVPHETTSKDLMRAAIWFLQSSIAHHNGF